MKDNKRKKGIEVKISPDTDQGTREKVSMIADLFNGPLFAKMVREAVVEMIMEGKLGYDLENDEFGIPLDIVKRWGGKMETKVWSRKKTDRK